jgi:hypothetical protein
MAERSKDAAGAARQGPNDDENLEELEAKYEEIAPPAALDDVEDAVAPEVGGELTDWSPPNQDRDVGEADAPAPER